MKEKETGKGSGKVKREPLRVEKTEFTDWKEAQRASDQNRTSRGRAEEELRSHCFVTGWLVCTEGPEKGRDYRLRYGFNKIGRSYEMDVCIFEDEEISRDAHCSVVYESRSNRFLLAPGQGTLTWLGGELVEEPREILSGERFQIGGTTLEFVAFCRNGVTWESR